MPLRSVPFLLLAGIAASALAAPPPAISEATLKDVTKTLSSDAFEGRAPSSSGEDKAVAYIVERFAKAGLKPGNKGSWFQEVPLVELTASPSSIRITGSKDPLTLAYKTDMVVSTRRVQPHVALTASDMVFVGYGIHAPDKGWDDYAGLDVRGKTVVILVNDPDWEAATLEGPFNGRAMTYYGRWTYKFEEAARQGAAAALIVHDTVPAAYGFNVLVSSASGGQFEIDTADNHMGESEAVGWITKDAATRLFAAAGKDLAQLSAAAKQRGFKAVPLGLKASVTIDSRIRRSRSRNVIGILPGTRRPQETILTSAHWDHLGHCEPVAGDGICNGARDNASGVAGLVALAEAQAKAGPAARSLVFLAVTAEEQGLLGSEYYAEHPVYPLGSTAAAFNMDELNVYGAARDVIVVGPGKSELEERLRAAAAGQGRRVSPEATPEHGSYYRSDHFSFAKVGVPAIAFDSGRDLVNGGEARGRALEDDFEAHRYHSPADEYDASWDWSGAVQDVGLIYTLSRDLAAGDAWPNWYPTAEFRGVRDASRAGASQ